eukprot:478171-Amphidinium_carterae.2
MVDHVWLEEDIFTMGTPCTFNGTFYNGSEERVGSYVGTPSTTLSTAQTHKHVEAELKDVFLVTDFEINHFHLDRVFRPHASSKLATKGTAMQGMVNLTQPSQQMLSAILHH